MGYLVSQHFLFHVSPIIESIQECRKYIDAEQKHHPYNDAEQFLYLIRFYLKKEFWINANDEILFRDEHEKQLYRMIKIQLDRVIAPALVSYINRDAYNEITTLELFRNDIDVHICIHSSDQPLNSARSYWWHWLDC